MSQALLGELHSKAERFKGHWTQKMWKKVRRRVPACWPPSRKASLPMTCARA